MFSQQCEQVAVLAQFQDDNRIVHGGDASDEIQHMRVVAELLHELDLSEHFCPETTVTYSNVPAFIAYFSESVA